MRKSRSGLWLLIGGAGLVTVLVVGLTVWVGSGHARMPLLLVPLVALNQTFSSEVVATIGEEDFGANGQAFSYPVSDAFGSTELRQLFDKLNSDSFQLPLTNYNCGDPVPKFKFQVALMRRSRTGSRRVQVDFSPSIDHAGRGRCLSSGLGYLRDKVFARIDPIHSKSEFSSTTREPHCDCSKRDGKEEWVTHPGPDEKLW